MKLFSLKGRVAVVTGACGLIGRHHCEALSEAGANVIVTDVSEKEVRSFTTKLGKNHLGLAMDVTEPTSVKKVKDAILKKFGQIDVLVNNAAINDMFENPSLAAEKSKFENYPLEMWQKSLDINVTGVFNCSQILGTQMAKQGKGSIINVASTYGIVAPDQSIYIDEKGRQTFYKSASYPVTKGAVISFTKFLASYWGNRGVRVNTLSP